MNDGYLDKRGFTLIEVLIAMALLSFGLMAVASLAGTIIKATESGRKQTQAVNLAVEKLEMLKAIPYADIQSTGGSGGITRACAGASPTFTCTPNGAAGTSSAPTVTINNAAFTWNWTVTYVDLDGDAVVVEATGNADSRDIKRIDLTVTWTDLFGAHSTKLTVLRKV